MSEVYVHLAGRDVDSGLFKIYGIEPTDNGDDVLKPKTCLRCAGTNPSANKFCNKCGMVFSLSEHAVEEFRKKKLECRQADEIMYRLLDDGEIRSILIRKIEEMKKLTE